MKTCFIYALCEPGTRTVRYIGKTINPKARLKAHLSSSSKGDGPLGNWLRSLVAPPNFVVLSEVPEAEGSAEEVRYVAAARISLGMDLVNSTDGGGGISGHKFTPEQRAAQSARQKGVPKGPWSPEQCAAQSVRQKGVPKGPRSPEHCAAISAAKIGVPHSLEHRAAIGVSQKGVPKSPQFRAAVSAALRGVPKSPEHCAALSAAHIGGKLPGASSKFKGVSWTSACNKWKAEIRVLGRVIFLGRFDTEIEAALAVDAAIKQHNLPNPLNFPVSQPKV